MALCSSRNDRKGLAREGQAEQVFAEHKLIFTDGRIDFGENTNRNGVASTVGQSWTGQFGGDLGGSFD